MSSEYLFKCKTNEAYVIKTLVELLHHTIKTACLHITPVGISLRMMNTNQQLLIDIELKNENFSTYFFNPRVENQKINIGVNMNHFYRMLKCIKKRDGIILFIEESDRCRLAAKIIPKDHSKETETRIAITTIDNLQIELPRRYDTSILVQSNDFSKMCKDLASISSTIEVKATKYNIKFYSDVESIYCKQYTLGTTGENFDTDDVLFEENFETEHITRIIKIAGLSNNLNLIYEKDMPFHISSRIGTLGTINLYIKSKSQIDEENIL